MHPASYVFGSEGFINQSGGWNNGLTFLFGLLSVQWTVRGMYIQPLIVCLLIFPMCR